MIGLVSLPTLAAFVLRHGPALVITVENLEIVADSQGEGEGVRRGNFPADCITWTPSVTPVFSFLLDE